MFLKLIVSLGEFKNARVNALGSDLICNKEIIRYTKFIIGEKKLITIMKNTQITNNSINKTHLAMIMIRLKNGSKKDLNQLSSSNVLSYTLLESVNFVTYENKFLTEIIIDKMICIKGVKTKIKLNNIKLKKGIDNKLLLKAL